MANGTDAGRLLENASHFLRAKRIRGGFSVLQEKPGCRDPLYAELGAGLR